ncbi:MAG: BMC domain-containing protein, partial [Cellulosilyticaceae bacterium]
DIYKKLGLPAEKVGAIGIMTITPSEGSIIAADVATKASDITLGFIDRFSGSLVIVGDVSSVEAAVKDVVSVLENTLHFTPTDITRT